MADEDSGFGSDLSEEMREYLPELGDKRLEVDESAYKFLEYISLDWPAQSLDIYKGLTVVLGTNPVDDVPALVSIDFGPTGDFKRMEKTVIKRTPCEESYNRVRVTSNMVYALSDKKLVIHNSSMEQVYQRERKEGLGYGLCFSKYGYSYGTRTGGIFLNDWANREVEILRTHQGSVESLSFSNELLFSASCDHSIAMTDVRSCKKVFSRKFGCDINAIDSNDEHLVAFGDDDGVIRLMDIRNHSIEEIRWHKSGIACIKWRDQETFASSSDEQVCIWDTSIEEEWEYEKYLLFVHQGQKYYKDITFCKGNRDCVVTTSIDGLCAFRPISFCDEEVGLDVHDGGGIWGAGSQ
jgi:ribosome assembly protein RRB1